jgi:DNA-binding transcriptional regulator YiaG
MSLLLLVFQSGSNKRNDRLTAYDFREICHASPQTLASEQIKRIREQAQVSQPVVPVSATPQPAMSPSP